MAKCCDEPGPDTSAQGCHRLKLYCIGGKLRYLSATNVEVDFVEADLYAIWKDSRTLMDFPAFLAAAKAEVNRQANEAIGPITVAQDAVTGAPLNDVALTAFRICFRIGWIRICIEILL